MWVLLALATALLTSLIPVVLKRLLSSIEVPVAIWAAQLIATPLLAIFAFGVFGWPSLDRTFFALIGVIILLNLGAHLAATNALKYAEASLVAPLLAVSPTVSLVTGLLLFGERPSSTGGIGVITMVAGAYLMQLERWSAWAAPLRALRSDSGPRLALIAAGIWGLPPLFEKQAILHTMPANPPLIPLFTSVGGSSCSFHGWLTTSSA